MILQTTCKGLQQNDPVRALNILVSLTLEPEYISELDPYSLFHRTAPAEQGHPIELSVAFTREGHSFLYEVSFLQKTVTHEALYLLQENKDNQPIYIASAQANDEAPRQLRVFEEDGTENMEYITDKDIALINNEEFKSSTIMSMASNCILWRGDLGFIAYEWFAYDLLPYPIYKFTYDGIYLTMLHYPFFARMINNIVTKIYPEIVSVEVQGDVSACAIVLTHQSPDGTQYECSIADESEELYHFFCKLEVLMDVASPGQAIVMDEMEEGISREQAQWVLDVFKPLVHKESQLIYRIGDEVCWVEG